MPIINRVAAMQDEVAGWRHDIHENPEILYDVHRTAGVVAEKLKAFGCDEVVTGHRPHRRGRRHPRPQERVGQGDRPARRHGRAADRRGDRPALRLEDAGQDARLRPRRPHRDAARRRANISPRRAISTAPRW